MKPGSTLYCVDIAEKMISKFDSRFRNNDFIKNSDNYYRKLDYSAVRTREKMDTVEENSKIGANGRKVYSMVSDVEQLPFPNNTFDAYTANLVLQFTPNFLNMLCESFRVLQNGGKAAFSIYGQQEN
jgi:SAM-dependent methyltransferase